MCAQYSSSPAYTWYIPGTSTRIHNACLRDEQARATRTSKRIEYRLFLLSSLRSAIYYASPDGHTLLMLEILTGYSNNVRTSSTKNVNLRLYEYKYKYKYTGWTCGNLRRLFYPGDVNASCKENFGALNERVQLQFREAFFVRTTTPSTDTVQK